MTLGISTYACSWEIGITAAPSPAPLDHFSFIRYVADLGVRVAQIADNLPLAALSTQGRKELRSLADSLNVQIEVGTRGFTEENTDTYIRIAEEFSSPVLRMVIDRESYQPDTSQVKALLSKVAPRLENAGIILAIENHDRFRCEEFIDMILSTNSAYVGICMDTVNSFGALEGPHVVIESLGPLTVNLHVKDFTVRRSSHQMGFVVDGCPAGQGQLQIPHLLSHLREFGRDPNAIIELWVNPEPTSEGTISKERDWLRSSVAYLRTLLPD